MANPSVIEYDGPYERWSVVMDGRRVPFLDGKQLADGSVDLMLDRRFGLSVRAEDAHATVWFIAQAIAVGLGYACHQTDEMEHPIPRSPFGGIVRGITTIDPPPLSVVQPSADGEQGKRNG